ncbi:TRAP transporter large permease [Enterocloster lavalensis]|uniref:TRAP transporter large permease n=1 Tax=Enterocloster lavalensis TaxID=460384 RepID=UPI00140A1EDB|nr:TRAP transporter large permease subunit [Enterocloster lavalensis]
MLSIVFIAFFALLLLGVPIAFVVYAATTIGIVGTGNNPVILVQQLFAGLNSFTLLAVPFFIISGDLAAKGSTSQRIVDAINVYFGHICGGLGVATICACTFFGAITGSSMATVVAVGTLMLPKLLENGYPKPLAVGIITVGGTLGVMIPPSVPMLTLSVAMEHSVGEQFTAGFIPGLLTTLAFSIWVMIAAKRQNIPRAPKADRATKIRVLKKSVWAVMFPVIVLGGIYSGMATPTEAAVISLVYVILVELFVYKKIKLLQMYHIIGKACVSAAALTLTIATARAFVWYLTTAQVPAMLYDKIVGAIDTRFALLLVLCLLFLIVGCFTNVITVCMILGPMLLGILQHFQVDLNHFGIIAIMMAQIGFVTPPFGLCLFVSMKVSDSSMGEVIRGSAPFLVVMAIVTLILVFCPVLSTFLPGLVFG